MLRVIVVVVVLFGPPWPFQQFQWSYALAVDTYGGAGTNEAIGDEISDEVLEGVRQSYALPPCDPGWLVEIESGGVESTFAAMIVTKDACKALVPRVAELLEHEDSLVRQNAVMMLGQLGESSVQEKVRRLLQDPNGDVAATALDAFCRLSPDDCDDISLQVATSKTDWRVRKAAVVILVAKGIPLDSETIAGLLSEAIPQLVIPVLEVLPCQRAAKDEEISRGLADLLMADRGFGAAINFYMRCAIPSGCTALRYRYSKLYNAQGSEILLRRILTAIDNCGCKELQESNPQSQ